MRLRLAAAAALTLVAGLAIRFLPVIPAAARDVGGSVAYVVCGALLLRLAGLDARAAVAGAFGWSCFAELLQAWHAPWLDAVRATWPGRLVLGTTYDARDFVSYLAGAVVALGVLKRVEP